MMKRNSLSLVVQQVEYIYDMHDTNAINFLTNDGYFCIQRSVRIDPDDDPVYNGTHIELNSQDKGDYYDFQEVLFSCRKIHITLHIDFLKEYNCIIINMPIEIDREIIDFFVNYLYLGNVVKYGEDIDMALHVKQTNFPEEL